MTRYSVISVIRNALHGNRYWPRAWRAAKPKTVYDVVIVGAGGHGLATAFYLAENHGIRNVAVVEKGYLGGGNVGATPPLSAPTTCSTAIPSSTRSR
jgi:methylglutamate dehydrogenase subunit A